MFFVSVRARDQSVALWKRVIFSGSLIALASLELIQMVNRYVAISTKARFSCWIYDFAIFQLAVIYKACSNPAVRRALFSATFAFEVEEWCKANLDNVVMVSIGSRNAATKTVDQKLVFVGNSSGKLSALRQIMREVRLMVGALSVVTKYLLSFKGVYPTGAGFCPNPSECQGAVQRTGVGRKSCGRDSFRSRWKRGELIFLRV